MTSKPLVSVIIPAYNAADFIDESIESILAQSYSNIEIIVIDDHSSDDTISHVRQFAKKDSRIRLIENKQNVGIGQNRNKGIHEARGKYICWQDADDISLPNRIDLQVAFMESHPHVGVVGGYITFFEGSEDGVTRRYNRDDEALRKTIFRYNPVAQPASMMRRECFDTVGEYNPKLRLSEDLEMQFRIGEKYEFGNVQQVILKYRQSSGSLTAANLKKMELVTLRIRSMYRQSEAYHFTMIDRLYNVAQFVSMGMPKRLRMYMFRLLRGDS